MFARVAQTDTQTVVTTDFIIERADVAELLRQRRRGFGGSALKATAALLDAKGGPDAAPFKTWLAGVAKSVAEAAPEGGFLGFGGIQVSETEKTTVAQIAAALGVPTPAV